jgi:hypothetical protein
MRGELFRLFYAVTPKPTKLEVNDLQPAELLEGSGCFLHDKMIAPVFLMGRGLLPPRKAKHGVGFCWSESFK